MKSLKDTPLAKEDAFTIEQQLNLLIDDFLIDKTDEGITTHPVIRDYFRAGHKITGTRREVADFLKARPGAERPKNIEEVRDLVEAVQLLCDDGEFKAAIDLVFSRLAAGGYGFNVFRDLPAVSEGLECYLAFVSNEERQHKVEKLEGKQVLSACYSFVALYNHILGNLYQAIEWRYKCKGIRKQLQDRHEQAFELHEISTIEMAMGHIRKARGTVAKAITLSHETKNFNDLKAEIALKAYYEFLLGNSIHAFQDYEVALYYEKKEVVDIDIQFLYSQCGTQQAEFFIRIKAWQQFEAVNDWNINCCKKEHWNNYLAICHLLQSWHEICQKRLPRAEKALAKAEQILRPSGMLEAICWLDWVWALLAGAKEDSQKGLQHVNDALLTCADKGFRLRQADHFVQRGRLYLLQLQKENQ